MVNSRYLSVMTNAMSRVPCSISLLWNLNTLVIYSETELVAPVEFWSMHRLKHIVLDYKGMRLPDPRSSNDSDVVVMENLQTLKGVNDLDLNEEVARRVPNIRELHIRYEGQPVERVKCLGYLPCLSKLENLKCNTESDGSDRYLEEISFPRTLKKLKIFASVGVELGHMLAEIGSLPLLHALTFRGGFFGTRVWETSEGQFPSLRSLTLCRALDLEYSEHEDLEKWTMPDDASSCFPLLEHLTLVDFETLEEIPSEVGYIPTLKSIELWRCGESVVLSAKRIIEEQEDLHGEEVDLHVEVGCGSKEQAQALQYLATPNFRVYVI